MVHSLDICLADNDDDNDDQDDEMMLLTGVQGSMRVWDDVGWTHAPMVNTRA